MRNRHKDGQKRERKRATTHEVVWVDAAVHPLLEYNRTVLKQGLELTVIFPILYKPVDTGTMVFDRIVLSGGTRRTSGSSIC